MGGFYEWIWYHIFFYFKDATWDNLYFPNNTSFVRFIHFCEFVLSYKPWFGPKMYLQNIIVRIVIFEMIFWTVDMFYEISYF